MPKPVHVWAGQMKAPPRNDPRIAIVDCIGCCVAVPLHHVDLVTASSLLQNTHAITYCLDLVAVARGQRWHSSRRFACRLPLQMPCFVTESL
jgi:hypothetical protein